ncbi:MAG: CxxC motif-containing protein (DUF1111 family) [Zhongshania sp.]|jgi:CxxC motif-containing protein (DUF1111 family)
MDRAHCWLAMLLLFGLIAGCQDHPETLSTNSGGSMSLAQRDDKVLQQAQPQLSNEQRLDWAVGKSFATQAWVSGRASTRARDGLGPLFNANRCVACHRENGQGQLPEHGPGLILRLIDNSAEPHHYGNQLQDHASLGHFAEGQISWQTLNKIAESPKDKSATLEYRRYSIEKGQYGPTTDIATSPRLAPALIGMGLLDGIDDIDILNKSDPEDRDGDGISGRAVLHWDIQQQRHRPGRFGWKASQASLKQQIALAFNQDIGITSTLYPEQNSSIASIQTPPSLEPEISDKLLNAVDDYIGNLAVPSTDPSIDLNDGYAIFTQLGCANCHQAAQRSRGPRNSLNTLQDTETIFPFSDLLLHDMGPGLSDNADSDAAAAAEWRTAPLWGLGIRSLDADHVRLLHDGRARSIHEAILWHGGEASASQARYQRIHHAQRKRLLRFLKAL